MRRLVRGGAHNGGMVFALALLLTQQEPIVPIARPGVDGRGRDPWVFRCIFEDRTRMVILAVAPDWWMAFNPETCAMHKVWRGKMDFRGKVWDFSQENSRAEGQVFFASPSELWRMPVNDIGRWKASGLTWDSNGWKLAPGGVVDSATFSLQGWQRVFVAFDETGRQARFDVRIRSGGEEQQFGSATHVSSDTDWQWNFKRVEIPASEGTTVRVTNPGSTAKKLRNLRMYGDRPSWFDTEGRPLKVIWRGYDLIRQTKGVTLRYDLMLPSGDRVAVQHSPDLENGAWTEKFQISGLPTGKSVRLAREGLGSGVRSVGQAPDDDDIWTFSKNGSFQLRFATAATKQPAPLVGEHEPSPARGGPSRSGGMGWGLNEGFDNDPLIVPFTHRAPPGRGSVQRRYEQGLSVRIWDLDGKVERHPQVGEGQRPNYYAVHKTLDIKDGVQSDTGPIRDTFAGTVNGWLRVPIAGQYRLRVTCDDGAKVLLDGRKVLDTENSAGFVDEVGIRLDKGDKPLEIPFYEDGGNFYLKLEWQKPGDAEFTIVPESNLLTEPGQTFVTAPGIKRWFYGADPRAPGDGRPVAGVHPGYKLETIRPPGFTPAVGGMAFLPDGRLAICTWDQVGAVHFISGLSGPASKVKVHTYADGFGEPLGIRVIDGDVWVTQKGEVTRLRDTDKDGRADAYDAMAGGWPASHNYHEFTFNLVPKGGKLYLSTSVPLRSGWTYYNPGGVQGYPIPDVPGSVLELDPKTGAWSIFATGLRTPNGMGLGVDGEVFVCDNQGSWLPSSKLIHVRRGGFYGHQLTPDGTQKLDPPALWLPHGEISNSPSEPILIPKGKFKGQMLFGDVTYGGIQRCNLEKVNGVYQGAVFRFTQGIEAGVNRLVWGPDGSLYIGGVGSNGDWNHQNHRFGLQRLVPTTEQTFEIHSVRATSKGFDVTFTEAFKELTSKNLEVDSFRYDSKGIYGGPKVDLNRFPVRATPGKDRKSVSIEVPEMKKGYVYHLRFVGLKSAKGANLWSAETWYTLNNVPGRP